MRRIVPAAAALVVPLSLLGGAVLAAPAQASSCSEKTGGSNDRLIKADNTETDADGWNCAYVYDFSVKIGAFMPGYQYHTTAMGYQKTYECHGQTGGVSIDTVYMDGGGVAPSSQEWWAYNSQDGSRHWHGAVLMMTRKASKDPALNQYTKGCPDSTIPFNAFYAVNASMTSSSTSVDTGSYVTLTIKLSGPDGPVPTGVQVGVLRQVGAAPDPTVDPAVAGGMLTDGALVTKMQVPRGTFSYYPAFRGSDWTKMTPPAIGWTPAQGKTLTITGTDFTPVSVRAASSSGVEEVRAARATPQVTVVSARGSRELTATCPTGQAPQMGWASSRTRAYGPADVTRDTDGVTVQAKGAPSALQLLCRNAALPAAIEGARGYGSIRGDLMVTTQAKSFFTGGLGDDRMTSRHARSALNGGAGADRLRLRRSGLADGSFGADRLRADGHGALLVGGPGRDSFSTGSGRVYVNAQDGRGGDTVTCGSAKTRVLADEGDTIIGPCTLR